MYTNNNMHKHNKGFTLVELLIVIVVIAILAVITTVVYNGLVGRASRAAVQADATNVSKQIGVFFAEFGQYPTAIQCPEVTGTTICAKPSSGSVINYSANNNVTPKTFSLTVSKQGVRYASNQSSSSPTDVATTPVTVTNLSTNGDFSAGSSGYVNHCYAVTHCNFSSGVLTLEATSSPGNRAMALQSYITQYNDQDRMYYSLLMKKISGSNFEVGAHRQVGGYNGALITPTQFNALEAGTTKRISAVRKYEAYQGAYTSLLMGQYSYTLDFKVQVDNVIVINLTKDFGAGNEPTAAQMDTMIDTVPGGWFNGTTTIYR